VLGVRVNKCRMSIVCVVLYIDIYIELLTRKPNRSTFSRRWAEYRSRNGRLENPRNWREREVDVGCEKKGRLKADLK